jgi:hypothetical protein
MDKPREKEAKVQAMEFMGSSSLLKKSEHNISLIIDTYDDIFSDFDPRAFHERTLSEDFLVEVRRRYIPGKKGGLEVRFIVPDAARDVKVETMIKRRLKSYFKEEENFASRKIKSKRRRGYVYIVFGSCLLFVTAYLGFSYPTNFGAKITELLFAPAAWFGMWTGIEKVIEHDETLEAQDELDKKLSEGNFIFVPESEALKGPAEGEPGDKEQMKEALQERVDGVKEQKRDDKEQKKIEEKEQKKEEKK